MASVADYFQQAANVASGIAQTTGGILGIVNGESVPLVNSTTKSPTQVEAEKATAAQAAAAKEKNALPKWVLPAGIAAGVLVIGLVILTVAGTGGKKG